MDCKELLDSLEIIEKEKGIPKETIFEAIETFFYIDFSTFANKMTM